MFRESLLLVVLIGLCAQSYARQVTFVNSCPFTIDVEATPGGIVCGSLGSGASCTWGIPSSGWSGNFHRHNSDGSDLGFPSATLAEFTFANSVPSQWNWDWFDISIIPPGCPGSDTSYEDCWCTSNNDGYDVGMVVTPSSCQSSARTCLGRECNGAYQYPSDNSKTTVCQDITGSFTVQFCPSGSLIDLGATQLSQTPPCRGGSLNGPVVSTPPPPSTPPPSTPPPSTPPPPSSPPSGGSNSNGCSITDGYDFYGNDISNKPVGSTADCCSYCSQVAGCAAWTYAYGVCYAKRTKGSDIRASATLISGTLGSANAVAADSQTLDNTPAVSVIFNPMIIVVAVLGVVIVLLIVLIVQLAITMKTRGTI